MRSSHKCSDDVTKEQKFLAKVAFIFDKTDKFTWLGGSAHDMWASTLNFSG